MKIKAKLIKFLKSLPIELSFHFNLMRISISIKKIVIALF